MVEFLFKYFEVVLGRSCILGDKDFSWVISENYKIWWNDILNY